MVIMMSFIIWTHRRRVVFVFQSNLSHILLEMLLYYHFKLKLSCLLFCRSQWWLSSRNRLLSGSRRVDMRRTSRLKLARLKCGEITSRDERCCPYSQPLHSNSATPQAQPYTQGKTFFFGNSNVCAESRRSL